MKESTESDKKNFCKQYPCRIQLESFGGVEQILKLFKICNEKIARVDQRMTKFETKYGKLMQRI